MIQLFRCEGKLAVATVILLLSMPHISAEDPAVIWDDCVAAARTGNPELKAAKEKVSQAAAAAGVTRSDLLPQISAQGSGSRASTGSDAGRKTANSFGYSLEGKQLLFDGLKSVYDYKGSLAAVDSAKMDYLSVSSSVRYNLRLAYVGLLQSQQSLELALTIEKIRKRNLELVRVKYESGSEHRGAFLTAKADYAQAVTDIQSAQRAILLAKNSLSAVMGSTVTPSAANGTLDFSDRYGGIPSFSGLAQSHPSVLKARVAREEARCSVRSSQLANAPGIYGTGSYGKQGDSLSSMKSGWSLGVSASLPLFEGGAKYYAVKKAAAALRQAEADEISQRRSVIVSMEQAWNALRDSIGALSVKDEYLKAETEREKIAEAQYSIGRMSFDDWTVIESGYVKAKQSFLSAAAAVLSAEAQWIQSIGGSLENETQK
jgi:outer membrane protein TolC